MRVIYVDTLFLLNFGVDYLLLLLTSRIGGIYRSQARLLSGAVTGAVFAVLLFFPRVRAPVSVLLQVIVWILVSLCTFGDQKKDILIRAGGLFCLLTAVLGGCVFALAQVTGKIIWKNGAVYYQVSGPILLLGFILLFALTGTVLGRGRADANRAFREICVEHGQAAVHFRALSDSGNLLRDPVSGRRVIVAECGAVSPLLGLEEHRLRQLLEDDPQRMLDALRQCGQTPFWLLPVNTVAKQGMIAVFRPQKLLVDGVLRPDQLLGLTAARLEIGGDCRALMGG